MTSMHVFDEADIEPLLTARFSLPTPPPGLVRRPRLFSELTAAKAVTVVQAPAGWGKTVLLSSWLAACVPGEAGWLSIERGDDAADFWRYFTACLRETGPADWLPLLHLPDRGDLTRIIHALIELPQPVTMVVDDVDRIRAADVGNVLDFLLRHSAGRLRLVLACRAAPMLPIHQWRLHGDLTEIGTEELAFTTAEAASMLQGQGFDLTGDQARQLDDRCEGWAAGLRLTAVATQNDAARATGRISNGKALLGEYLTREVLSNQPAYLQDLLLDTAIVPRLCGALIEALSGGTPGDRVLRDLLDANLLIPLEGEPGWYRYHPQFAEAMQTEQALRDPTRVEELHRLAAAWYIEHDLPLDAFRHAITGQDWSLTARVLYDRWCELIAYDYPTPPFGPTSRPPDASLIAEPEVALACALERLTRHDPDDATECLRLAERPSSRIPARRRHQLRLIAAALELTCAWQRGSLPEQQAAASRMLDLLPSGGGDRRDEAARAIALTALGRGLLAAGELGRAASTLASALALAARCRLACPQLAAASALAVAQALQGELHAAERTARSALDMPGGPGRRDAEDAHAHLALAIADQQWDRLDEATVEIHCALTATGHASDPGLAASIAVVCAEFMCERGELTEGLEVLRSARHEMRDWSIPQHLAHWFDAAEADLRTAHGDAAAARLLLPAAPPSGDAGAGRRAVTLARTYLCDGDPASATDTVAPWTENVKDAGCPVSILLDATLVRAVAAHRLGDARGSADALERVLRLAEPNGFRRMFTRGGPEVHDMLLAHLDSGTAYWSLVTNLVAAGRPSPESHAPPRLQEPLSERELTVLRYLQSILSNAEIAAEMSVSVNTVKTHVRNIYRKLEACQRRDAVRRARSLQLL